MIKSLFIQKCEDAPQYHFLRRGATYHLLGRSHLPKYHDVPDFHTYLEDKVHFELNSTNSKLYNVLCNSGYNSSCSFQSVVKLHTNLDCLGEECELDNLRVIKVQEDPPIYYEYIRPGKDFFKVTYLLS